MKKVAIVTGSTRGIGRGIADALSREGYLTVYVGTSSERRQDLPADCEYIPCNIANGDDRAHLIDETIRRHGRLDVLVNNAGVAPERRMDLLQTTEESFDRVLDVNLRGTFFLCQYAARRMVGCLSSVEAYAPRIINISSISAYTASITRGEYCISKAGISMVTQLFADRLAEYGIPVFEIRPGVIDTDMIDAVRDRYESLIDEGLTPIRRLGKPEDVAKMVLAACSGLLDFTTGQVLNADGGYHLRRL